MTGIPAFVDHDDLNREFTVNELFDPSHIGIYPVTISVSIQVPDDYTKTTYTTHTFEQVFNIIVEPCLVTSIDIVNALPNYSY